MLQGTLWDQSSGLRFKLQAASTAARGLARGSVWHRCEHLQLVNLPYFSHLCQSTLCTTCPRSRAGGAKPRQGSDDLLLGCCLIGNAGGMLQAQIHSFIHISIAKRIAKLLFSSADAATRACGPCSAQGHRFCLPESFIRNLASVQWPGLPPAACAASPLAGYQPQRQASRVQLAVLGAS